MAKKPTFDSWLEDTKARLKTEDQKKALETLLSDEGLKESVFGGHLREADYYRRVNDVNEKLAALTAAGEQLKQQQEEWKQWHADTEAQYAQLQAEKDELEKRVKYADIDDTDASAEPSKVTPRIQAELEELRRAVEQNNQRTNILDESTIRLIGDTNKITLEALRSGLDVDPAAVLEYSAKNKVDPYSAFEVLTRDQRAAQFAEAEKKKLEMAREEGRLEERSKRGPEFVAPRGGPSTVEFFTKPNDLNDAGARSKAASELYAQLIAKGAS